MDKKLEKTISWTIGNLLLDRYGRFFLITKIEGNKVYYQQVGDDHVSYTTSLGDYIYIELPRGVSVEDHIAALEKKAFQNLTDPNFYLRSENEANSSTALITSSGPDRLQESIAENNRAIEEINTVRRIVEARVSQIAQIASLLSKQIGKWARVLGVFELYLGIGEQILQLREGEMAPADMPISVRQLVLFMDEEVGDVRNSGIDFESVEKFDEWAMDHIEQLIPEEKCVVAFRPSRQQRWWYDRNGNNFFGAAAEDKQCYLLIRNGENFYRILTNFHLGETFIPTKAQLKETVRMLEEEEWNKDKVDKTQLHYARNAMLVQGIVDRTEVFNFLQRPDVLNGFGVEFIYDAEYVLPDGHKPYREWQKELNSQVKRGSRILFSDRVASRYFGPKGHHSRFKIYYSDDFSAPSIPDTGVYTVEKVEHYRAETRRTRLVHTSDGRPSHKTEQYDDVIEYDKLWIKYQPGGSVYTNWGYDWKERQNRVSFMLQSDDNFFFNYDLLDLADIEFYINCRTERQHYLDVLPTLYALRKKRLAELEWEKGFVKLLSETENYPEESIWKWVDWWKKKVIHKRPLTEDDSKAWRMIKGKLKKEKI